MKRARRERSGGRGWEKDGKRDDGLAASSKRLALLPFPLFFVSAARESEGVPPRAELTWPHTYTCNARTV